MFNLRLCNAATIRYSLLKIGHKHLCGKRDIYFSPHCCKCNSFGCIAAIRCSNACHGPHSDSVYSGSKHRQFNSPRLVKCEVGFPNSRRALIGSNQLWRVDDSPYYREYRHCHCILHQAVHIDCSAPSGKQHEPLTGVWGITHPWSQCWFSWSL